MNRLTNMPEDMQQLIWKHYYKNVMKQLTHGIPDHPIYGLKDWRYEEAMKIVRSQEKRQNKREMFLQEDEKNNKQQEWSTGWEHAWSGIMGGEFFNVDK